ncbi:universal stress protein [Haloquadratum walsbyi]|uniref:UspA domain protein n=1 Tax=Haloquadratum walsbyi (strain DSM 16790 / HBSQ001) TaxID=362976 RepID=Q18I17_HALWD|nr:universal stress protein [Haloquadratum walsbyi]CAJ52361.1 UspA domain protein [Haloquadratum walsbyi DSM 16790]
MSKNSNKPSVLVPIDASTDEQPDPRLLELLKPARVVLAGWYPVPHQTPPEQLKRAHEDEVTEYIETIASNLRDDDTAIETVVVFTPDKSTTVDRLADEYNCGVVLVSKAVKRVKRILVPIRTDINLQAILLLVGVLIMDSEATVTLLYVAEADEDTGAGKIILRGATDELQDAGINPGRIDTVTLESDTPINHIVDAAVNHDLLVIGESEPSLIEQIIGDVPGQLLDQTDRPVLIVRKLSTGEKGNKHSEEPPE